jgi:hypothetical protein
MLKCAAISKLVGNGTLLDRPGLTILAHQTQTLTGASGKVNLAECQASAGQEL